MPNKLAMKRLTQGELKVLLETESHLISPEQLSQWSLQALKWIGFVPDVLFKVSKGLLANPVQALFLFALGRVVLSHAEPLPKDTEARFKRISLSDQRNTDSSVFVSSYRLQTELTSRDTALNRKRRDLESDTKIPQQPSASQEKRRLENAKKAAIYSRVAEDRDLIANDIKKIEDTSVDANFSSTIATARSKLRNVKQQDYYLNLSSAWKNKFNDFNDTVSFLESSGLAIIDAGLAYESYKTNVTLDITPIIAKKDFLQNFSSKVINLTGEATYALPIPYQEAFKNFEKKYSTLVKVLNEITAFNGQLESEKSQNTFPASDSELLRLQTEISFWYERENSTVARFKYCSIRVTLLNTEIQYLIKKHSSIAQFSSDFEVIQQSRNETTSTSSLIKVEALRQRIDDFLAQQQKSSQDTPFYLPNAYKEKLEIIRRELLVLHSLLPTDVEKLIQNCADAFKARRFSEASTCGVQSSQRKNGSYNADCYHSAYGEKVVRLIYDDKVDSFYNILLFIAYFPCVDQRVEAYQTLFASLQTVDKNELKQLDDMLKRLNGEERYMSAEFKKKFESLKLNIQSHLEGYKKYNKMFRFISKTAIQSNTIKIPMSSYYNLSSTSNSFQDELKKSYREARELIAQYQDFVLPSGAWMSHQSDQAQLTMWVCDKKEESIFGGAGAFFQFTTDDDGFVNPDGIFSHREYGYINAFKHEFMHALLAGGIGRYDFYRSIPRWFNEGLAELAQHGPCNKNQLNSLKKYRNAKVTYSGIAFSTAFNKSISMIDLTAKQQREQYPDDWTLNYFLSYFHVLYLRMRHPEFLLQILHDTHQRGWEGSDNSSLSVRERLSVRFASKEDIFRSWLVNSTENPRFCFDSQVNSQFKLSGNSVHNSVRYFLSVRHSSMLKPPDEPSAREQLINALNTADHDSIDSGIEFYRNSLRQEIKPLLSRTLTINEALERYKIYRDAALRFLDKIYSQKREISIAYYYYYSDLFLKLVFEEIIIPIYKKENVETQQIDLKQKIQLEFNDLLQHVFSKELPPDREAFLSWYRTRCHETGFCTADELDTTVEMLSNEEKSEFGQEGVVREQSLNHQPSSSARNRLSSKHSLLFFKAPLDESTDKMHSVAHNVSVCL